MNIEKVTQESFRNYGRIIDGYDWSDIMERMQKTPMPDDVVYVRKDSMLEQSPVYAELKTKMYGECDIQFGFCNGHNKSLNALEYHRCSEVNLAVTDMVLLLGKQGDLTDDYKYDTSKIKAFFVPKGVAVEIYATTLHYAPCNTDEDGFRCLVVLPEGTNKDLEGEHDKLSNQKITEDSLLAAQNKWLVAHAEANIEGAYNGLFGKNVTID